MWGHQISVRFIRIPPPENFSYSTGCSELHNPQKLPSQPGRLSMIVGVWYVLRARSSQNEFLGIRVIRPQTASLHRVSLYHRGNFQKKSPFSLPAEDPYPRPQLTACGGGAGVGTPSSTSFPHHLKGSRVGPRQEKPATRLESQERKITNKTNKQTTTTPPPRKQES